MPRCRFVVIPSRTIALIGNQPIAFDATTKQGRRRGGQVVMHPKQSGLDGLTDDVLLDPEGMVVTAHFVDFPLYYGPGQFGYEGRAKLLADAVREVHARKLPCAVLAGDDVLSSMVIASIGSNRGPDTGAAVDLELEFQHIEIGELGVASAIMDAASQALGAEAPAQIGLKP